VGERLSLAGLRRKREISRLTGL